MSATKGITQPQAEQGNSQTKSSSTAEPNHSSVRERVAKGEAFKVIVVGNSDVGKTRMTYVYANGELPPKNMKATVGVGYYGKTIPFFL